MHARRWAGGVSDGASSVQASDSLPKGSLEIRPLFRLSCPFLGAVTRPSLLEAPSLLSLTKFIFLSLDTCCFSSVSISVILSLRVSPRPR